MTLELSRGSFRLVVDPDLGGAILRADWRDMDGRDVAIFEPSEPTFDPFGNGCYALVPFANRIADGRFSFEGRDYELPINRPQENVAIHGFAYERPWEVARATSNSVSLFQRFAESDNPYEYEAWQEISLLDEGLQIEVSVRNAGDRAMPFGLGIHPWFARSLGTTLAFLSQGTFEQDTRNLPLPKLRQVAAFNPDHPVRLEDVPVIDGCFANWTPLHARIVRPQEGVVFEITAGGALRHLHVFVPDNRNVFCAEPVSHVPDVVNRPEFGPAHAMDVLQPGEVLSGAMTLRAKIHSSVGG